jgi:hypothetical protein
VSGFEAAGARILAMGDKSVNREITAKVLE